ncbi:hypothetical protein J2S43_005378 [Catenuloplanes nepalensis]|uniref:Uncharacterized protein n=1 Tax=Catenuloplanes nepalensis TaxID=587533 RepID=A0ABT9N0S0_9ACTN|nr:hypothetical protein [Catenuloplanes nepalensis]
MSRNTTSPPWSNVRGQLRPFRIWPPSCYFLVGDTGIEPVTSAVSRKPTSVASRSYACCRSEQMKVGMTGLLMCDAEARHPLSEPGSEVSVTLSRETAELVSRLTDARARGEDVVVCPADTESARPGVAVPVRPRACGADAGVDRRRVGEAATHLTCREERQRRPVPAGAQGTRPRRKREERFEGLALRRRWSGSGAGKSTRPAARGGCGRSRAVRNMGVPRIWGQVPSRGNPPGPYSGCWSDTRADPAAGRRAVPGSAGRHLVTC